VYHGKEREEDIASTLAVPLQEVRTFGKNGHDWHNMLILSDNLQVMKSLLEMKKSGRRCNGDGTPGIRLVYIDPPSRRCRSSREATSRKPTRRLDKYLGPVQR
jgi:site-specific DNA-methyltransferase (adenine-specific)/adenine-specific DNA-methyltransferase